MPTRTYPSTVFENAARAAGASVKVLWEERGPKNTMVDWHACYEVNGWPVIVQTYKNSGAWNVFTPPATNDPGETIADALKRCGVLTPVIA